MLHEKHRTPRLGSNGFSVSRSGRIPGCCYSEISRVPAKHLAEAGGLLHYERKLAFRVMNCRLLVPA